MSRYDEPAFRCFLRRYQRECLLHGKREATRRVSEAQAQVWHAAHAGVLDGVTARGAGPGT